MGFRILEVGRVFKKLDSDEVAAAGKAFFYETGTTTLKDTFSNVGLTATNANPMTLGSDGRLPAEAFGSGSYTARINDADGDLAWTDDDIRNDAVDIDYTPGVTTGATVRTVQAYNRDEAHIRDFGALGDDQDDTTALANAAAEQAPITFDPGIYNTTAEVTITDATRFIGANAFMGIRANGTPAMNYVQARHSVIKYVGSGGSNTVVLRCSDLAVGSAITDTTPPDTDDLFDAPISNMTIDANALAEIGIYCYRNIETQYDRVAVTKAKEMGWYVGASFANTWRDCTAFLCEKNGWEIGTAVGGLTQSQMRVNGNEFMRASARYNGTGKDYNQTTNPGEGNGFVMVLSFGNIFTMIDSEINDGAGIFLTNDSSGSGGGPNIFHGGYLEANMTDVVGESRGTGAYELNIDYDLTNRHTVFDGTYISGTNDGVLLQIGTNPSLAQQYIKFINCHSGPSVVDIDANTQGFKVIDCAGASGQWTYSNQQPMLQTLTGAGAVNPVLTTIHIVTTGVDALTLADGVEGAPPMFLVMKTDGGTGTLTPANFGNGSTITFDDAGDSAHLFFTNGKWYFMGGTATLT